LHELINSSLLVIPAIQTLDPGASSPLKPWSKCSIEDLGGSILANLGGRLIDLK